ncbi:phosphatidylinositol-glycan biosynthesis class W protein [Mitosporidium daphniae]|uniref:GPI-anchored wall transfer protein 1 n=1 Tax=Mitosporidium daphniae TaxID=1485682 RepID=A0A098VMT1_9MICR|nr:phosphatidylinositol-glycan biosynthesis class W protein [Mitosporidium daphniae]KGG50357.1 phosphatidylinositol-glycan biosynthesis class W protein [Mitosporidium daphniae]|eukprot:XP_013236784.1 phosphatidylinositol-glycan biosynthesis class W protein [Mitosporidium daphniae]
MFFCCLFLFLCSKKRFFTGIPHSNFELSTVRASIFFQTYLSIFAVDFSVYPLRFAKTETYGISLMDIGVGCYIGINAANASYRNLRAKSTTHLASKPSTNLLLRIGPLLALSLLRLISLKLVGYPEHVSEYGIHWNFFLSLAMIALFCDLIRRYLPPSSFYFIGLGLAISFLCDIIFYLFDLVPIILSNEIRPVRLDSFTDFVLMNKEGIASLPGYISIYLIIYGSCFGNKKMFLTPLFLMAYFFCDAFVATASRRLCNCAFVFWAVFFLLYHSILSTTIRSCLNAPSERPMKEGAPKIPNIQFGDALVEAINYSPLVTFLFANLLTGLVNMTIQSLFLSQGLSCVLVLLYGCIVGCVGHFLKLYYAIK